MTGEDDDRTQKSQERNLGRLGSTVNLFRGNGNRIGLRQWLPRLKNELSVILEASHVALPSSLTFSLLLPPPPTTHTQAGISIPITQVQTRPEIPGSLDNPSQSSRSIFSKLHFYNYFGNDHSELERVDQGATNLQVMS